jgi:hypothetical protein
LFVDVAALLAGGLPQPPAPIFCHREDGVALFYAEQVSVVFGDPESGKTWLVMAACIEALADGLRVLLIDADHNGASQTLSRLLLLGGSPDALSDPDRFRLAEPEDAQDLLAVVAEARRWQPAVAVVDSVGEVLPMLGLSSNSPDDYTHAHRRVFRPLMLSGAAVLIVDHLAKSPDSRAAGQTGTAAKARSIGGVSLRVTCRETFAPGRGGSAVLSIRKDRPGGLRARCPVVGKGEQSAGVFALIEHPEGLLWRITEPRPEDAVTPAEVAGRTGYTPTDDDVAAIDGLDPEQQASVRKVRDALSWGNDKATASLRAWRELRANA